MPKRKREHSTEYYQRKIRKLKEQQKRYHRRILIESSSDSDENASSDSGQIPKTSIASVADDTPGVETNTTATPYGTAPEPDTGLTNEESDASPELDPELLGALGEETGNDPKYGEKIHQSLSQRWEPLLRKGLSKEAKEKLLKEYLVPENCTLLQAPKLNSEVASAISEASRQRDKRKEIEQQQIGVGISAINKALTLMLTGDNKVEAIRIICDGCRILTDLHHLQTQARKSVNNCALAKPFLNIVQDSERDDFLYGNKLAEKIKASETIEKQGLTIKKYTKTSKTTVPTEQVASSSSTRPQYRPGAYQGNWTGPSRFQQIRGGAQRVEQDLHPCDESPPATADSRRDGSEQAETVCDAPIAQKSTYPGCRSALGQAFASRGVPESAINLMMASLSSNTMQQYAVSFKLWWQFCNSNGYNIFDCSVPSVLHFLIFQYNEGASYGSLNSHRSALSLLLGNKIGSDDCVKRLLKGAFKLKPSFPKYCNTWDPHKVLNHVSNWYPNRELSREKITKKLAILLAICTAQRVQTMSLIKLENIKTSLNGIDIAIKYILKTSAAGRDQPNLFLPFFRENPRICPATTLEDYIHVTREDRPANVSNLLITVKRPYKSATAQSISRWIKQVLAESGVDVETFTAHSTRHASTSAAASAGVSIDNIRKAARWTETSKVFAKFYHRPLVKDNNFAQSILQDITDD